MVKSVAIVMTHLNLGPENSVLCADRLCLRANDPIRGALQLFNWIFIPNLSLLQAIESQLECKTSPGSRFDVLQKHGVTS